MVIFYAILLAIPYFCSCSHSSHGEVFEANVTNSELQDLNATCPTDNTCFDNTIDLSSVNCNCEAFCARLGTCCVHSENRFIPSPSVRPHCLSPDNSDSGFLMIDKCPKSSRSKSAYDDLCKENRENENDLMRLTPVTSLYTHITYKNYFCFLCHELNDDHIFWNVQILYDGETDVKADDPNVQLDYDEEFKTWVASVGKGGCFAPVNLEFVTPPSIAPLTRTCSPSLILHCSEYWPEDEIRVKSEVYMHVTNIERDGVSLKYKNPHGALCNYENLANKVCPPEVAGFGVPAKRPFSFTYLLDINRSDGDKVGKVDRCDGSGVWDPFFKKCRALKCALPGYIMQDGKCVQPQP